ncbi:MAG: GyrI-like domain-containing protein [Devosia nanyangense]|uniref:GyrI-like domain-containing protein n=1 Tax=Devosia nanyangense TaxID=1228055 RepID=A0A933P060_9HYPH|nr:GyrI-like domain-containing protein [Devosia nanyangense]
MSETVEKVDYKKRLKAIYTAPAGAPVVVDVPAMNFLMVDGIGDPNTVPAFGAAVEALYGVAYALKFMVKKSARPVDYGVMPLEGLWWADDMAAFRSGNRAAWRWTAMIMQPDIIGAAEVAEALAATRRKRPTPALELLRFEAFAEGHAAQVLHVGSFATEPPTIERLHTFIAAQGRRLEGKHHEIYLSDMRRTAPEKLRTIIRQPFAS